MVSHTIESHEPGRLARIGHGMVHEFYHLLPPTIFFFVGFNLILFTKRLILADYLIQFTGFLIATVSALVVGKAVLVADMMPFLRRFDTRPLAVPILFKATMYTLFVLVARLLEALIHYLVEGGALGHGGFVEHQLGAFHWHQFVAVQLWIFVLFLVYVTASELNTLLGDGELFKIFFKRRSTELKAARRARIRLLARLSRLTAAHPIEELSDRASAAYAELAAVLRELAR
jgi:hypothetical protein